MLAQNLQYGIEAAAKSLHRTEIHNHLECQSAYAQAYYGWNKIGTSWKRFIEGAVNAMNLFLKGILNASNEPIWFTKQ